MALSLFLVHLQDQPANTENPVVLCTDSQSAIRRLQRGPSAQSSPLGVSIWRSLLELASPGRQLHLQWVSSHCGLSGNERADELANAAAALPQDDVLVDVRTVYRVVARVERSRIVGVWPAGWYRSLMGDRLPPPVRRESRLEAVDIHQLRAGHWSGSAQYLHRIGRHPSPSCARCSSLICPAGWCRACGEEGDTPDHVLLRFPALMLVRHRIFGTIFPSRRDVGTDDAVAVLARAARYLQNR